MFEWSAEPNIIINKLFVLLTVDEIIGNRVTVTVYVKKKRNKTKSE